MTYDDDWNTSILSMILKIYGYKIKYIDSDQITKTIKKSKSSNKFLKLFNKLITLKNRKVFIACASSTNSLIDAFNYIKWNQSRYES